LSYAEALRKSGHLVVAEPLQSVRTATTLRVRKGKLTVTDGRSPKPKKRSAAFF
jgi:hypothetical protein